MSKCDLVRAEELTRRYTVLEAELAELQLRYMQAPLQVCEERANLPTPAQLSSSGATSGAYW